MLDLSCPIFGGWGLSESEGNGLDLETIIGMLFTNHVRQVPGLGGKCLSIVVSWNFLGLPIWFKKLTDLIIIGNVWKPTELSLGKGDSFVFRSFQLMMFIYKSCLGVVSTHTQTCSASHIPWCFICWRWAFGFFLIAWDVTILVELRSRFVVLLLLVLFHYSMRKCL